MRHILRQIFISIAEKISMQYEHAIVRTILALLRHQAISVYGCLTREVWDLLKLPECRNQYVLLHFERQRI
jgi:hypothetical protein